MNKGHKDLFAQAVVAVVLLGTFVVWFTVNPRGLHASLLEDGVFEYLSSLFYGLSSLAFVVCGFRSGFLREKSVGPRYWMIGAWALLMIVFMGEEISWGQRLFGFATPETLSQVNKQHEFNVHNIELVDSALGGKYRFLSIMMLTTGLLLPLFAATAFGRRVIQWWGFPVAPMGYTVLFVGAYVFGKFAPGAEFSIHDADEVREFLLSCAMLLFASHAAVQPCAVFRTCTGDGRASSNSLVKTHG